MRIFSPLMPKIDFLRGEYAFPILRFGFLFPNILGCYSWFLLVIQMAQLSQLTFTCAKLTKETLEQYVEYVQS